MIIMIDEIKKLEKEIKLKKVKVEMLKVDKKLDKWFKELEKCKHGTKEWEETHDLIDELFKLKRTFLDERDYINMNLI